MLTTMVMALFLGRNEQGRKLLQRGRAIAPDLALGALLGIAVFLLVYGFSTLDVTYDSWIYAGYIEEDIIQRYAGWLYFRAADWTLPLTVANNLSVPYGASITFTDSIPLVAILCKALSPILPETFQYFGWVNLLNFALQGAVGMLLLREFALSRAQGAFGALVFLLAPVFVERAFRHDGLGAQWLLLWALWLYFRARHSGRVPAVSFFALCTLSPAIHFYFTPLIYALLAATLAEYVLREKKWKGPLVTLGACFGGSFVTAYLIGIVTRGGGGGADGFGRYSMNLNALWNPTSFDRYAESGNLVWSRVLPVLGQTDTQYEGFNYLGLGLLAGCVLLAVYGTVRLARAGAGRRALLQSAAAFLKSHLPLLVVCTVLAVFAVSNVVYFGASHLFTYPLPGLLLRLGAIFRASGRMFWLCYYLLVLCVLVGAARLLRRRKPGTLALAVLLAVQVFDTSGALWQKHAYFAGGQIRHEDEFTSAGWVFLATHYEEFTCLNNLFDYNLGAGIIRYNPAARTNMILTNRLDFEIILDSYAPNIEYLATGGEIAPGEVYILEDPGTFAYILAGLHPDARGYQTGKYYAFCLPVEGCPLEAFVPAAAEA